MSETLRPYAAFYKNKRTTVHAPTALAAQEKAAAYFNARKRYDVTVVLADVPVSPSSLG